MIEADVTRETDQINDFANGLVVQIWNAKSDADVVCLCKKYEKQVQRLESVARPRYLHIVNAVQFKRREFRGWR